MPKAVLFYNTNMPSIILICFTLYTATLFVVTRFANQSTTNSNEAYFRANRKSPWFVVAYGGIGATMSGVTFMSVPGYVQISAFTYFGVILGNMVGFLVVSFVLLPLYYKLNLTSIYVCLNQRFGYLTQRTGSLFFFVSRLLGSALRMYLVVYVLYEFVFKAMNIPFWVPAVVFVVIILLYTLRGGLRVVVWTDTLQTTFMLTATLLTIYIILRTVDLSFLDFLKTSSAEGYTKLIETNWKASNFFGKQLFSGIFLTIALNGLDQDMIQKNLSCRTLKDAQKNVFVLSLSMIVVNLLFLTLGAALLYYAKETGFLLPDNPDSFFPAIAFRISNVTMILFIIGLLAAGYSSADGTLTALTTVVCYDFFGFANNGMTEKRKTIIRKIVHLICASLFLCVIIIFRPFHDESLIKTIFDIAALSYGPLLGLFGFGLFTKWTIKSKYEKLVPVIAVLAPIICYFLKMYSTQLFNGYMIGFELLIINGLLTFIGLRFISQQGINN